jgi:threonine/homoserine/homoserine lactone efflux protein
MDYLTGPLLAFLGISALVIMTPGPDTAVTIRNTLTGGRAGGVATALGIATGQAIWALATSAIAAFFTSLLPQFVPPDTASFAGLALLGLLFSLLTLFWLVFYTLAIARIGIVLSRSPVRRALEGMAGAALVGLGLRLAAENR